ncbi:ribosomal-protein-alanine acetyltransferase [Coraliomargarita sinensis]|uniref:Ribosomal-protein-alanine acetyltransferase n=1 Tax=Coraliomargarita sinensis TaxID=2174842 RepID=A0A317ZIR8_9BACT|nr:GNAT family N-acetyltransferase/peptidase C39 family protein [Coraliomargarita sinensis]PXA04113.1 ribosomal-protein-alanine acetyltransferase [Coraliomargarita sinensis]
MGTGIVIREALRDDLDALVELENACFATDRLSRRSFQRWLKGEHSVFHVATSGDALVGYGLVLLHSGTRLARLYSIAVAPAVRGKGIAQQLLGKLEEAAEDEDRFFMRLEVAKENSAAVRLYEKLGYSVFDEWEDYYEDHSDALRMQKRIRFPEYTRYEPRIPWFAQSTSFTCGPACLLMLMSAADPQIEISRALELDLWREATTIYMTSGHGGCHPVGLALAAQARGFHAEVRLSLLSTPFLEGVRATHKKEVLDLVHEQFMERGRASRLPIVHEAVSISQLESWLTEEALVMVLISSYRLNNDKAPHWVVVTAQDELCFYLHDPDVEKLTRSSLDCQDIPIAKQDFGKMLIYGSNRYSAAVVLHR